MSASETAHTLKILLLKHPKRAAMRAKLAKMSPDPVKVQVNNKTMMVPGNKTLLQVCHENFGEKVPYNCQAGICGACEAKINGKLTKLCYTPVYNGARIVTLNHEMMMWRQGTADE